MKQIKIADRTLCRDEGSYSFKEKLEIARRLDALRVDAIELPEITNERADTLLVKTVASFVKDSVISVAAGSSADSVALAAAALKTTAKPRIRVELPVSPATMEYQYHKKAPKMLEWIAETIGAAAAQCGDVEFCARDAANAESDFLADAIKTAVGAGAKSVTVCDDTAFLAPDDFAAFAEDIAKSAGVPVGIMCSDKFDCASAQALLAAKNGALCVKTAVDGGITPLEAFAGALQARGEHYGLSCNLRFTEIHRTVRQIKWISDESRNETESAPAPIADDSAIRLDAADDRTAVDAAVAKLGYDLSEDDAAKVYEEFLRVSGKKTVNAKELDAIVASTALQVPSAYTLENYVIYSGNSMSASAQITLKKNGEPITAICLGDGPIDAAFLTLEHIIKVECTLDDFQIQSLTEGKNSVGKAVVKLRTASRLYSGSGISTDIIGASIRAYINAANKIIYEEE